MLESYERSPVYWVGWMITHYQWYSCHSFKSILDTVPYKELLGLYERLHEADIQKSYEVMEAHFSVRKIRLQLLRKQCGLTQETLANESGVSLNTIRAYVRKSKDLNKAQSDIIINLTKVLKCQITDLLD